MYMISQSKINDLDKLNAEEKCKRYIYTVANYFTSRKFLKSTKNSQLPKHLDARGVNKNFESEQVSG